MPKIIIDGAAIDLLASKCTNQPIYSGSGGKLLSPGIISIVDSQDDWDQWQPGDERTRLLVLGGEACQEILFQAERFNESAH